MFQIENIKAVYPISEKERKIKTLKKYRKQKQKKGKEGENIKIPSIKHIDILV